MHIPLPLEKRRICWNTNMKLNYSEFDVGRTTRNINCTMWIVEKIKYSQYHGNSCPERRCTMWLVPKYSLAKNPCTLQRKLYVLGSLEQRRCTMWILPKYSLAKIPCAWRKKNIWEKSGQLHHVVVQGPNLSLKT